jgi:hypothetical protein
VQLKTLARRRGPNQQSGEFHDHGGISDFSDVAVETFKVTTNDDDPLTG